MTDDLNRTSEPAGETFEPATEAAPAASVLPPDPTGRGGRRRWAIALGFVAVVVAATGLTLGLFTGQAANATVLGYVPADSLMYGEVRLDLPGDQRANLGQFLSRFPGFADQSTLDTKLDEVFDRVIGAMTEGEQTWSANIKPWFGGELAFSVGALPDPSQLSARDEAAMDGARALLLLSIEDEAAAKAWLDSVIAAGGGTATTELYGGATLTLVAADGGQQGAYALLDGKVAVAGDVASVKAAIDTKGASGFASTPEMKAALAANDKDHIGFVYLALRPLMEFSTGLAGSGVADGLPSEAILGLVPDWAVFALRVEGDALVMATVAPKPASGPEPTANRSSALADHVPGNAVVLSISHDYGRAILQTIDAYRSDPAMAPAIEMIDQAVGLLGGTESAIGWIGDFGITVTRSEATVEGGLIIVPTDRAAAERLFTSLRNLVALGGSTVGITVRDEAYAGTMITIIDLGNLSDLGDLAGMAGLSPDMIGAELPTGRVELAYAITDQVVVLGSSPSFVRSVLDTTPATSIAANERYMALATRLGDGNGYAFVDISSIRDLIESAIASSDPSALATYEEEIKPFLVPFDAMAGSTSIEGDLNRSTLIVTVK